MPLVLVGFLPFNIGWPEAIILGLIAIVLFGRRLPQVGRQLGKGLVEFKKGLQGMQDEIENAGTEPPPRPPASLPPPDADASIRDVEADDVDDPEPKTDD